MNAEERQQLRERMETELEQVRQDMVSLQEQAQPIAPENAIGRLSRMDAINNKTVVDDALRKARYKLAQLEKALRKVDLPGFGTCSECGKPIQPARLMYMPEATRCVRCADR